MKEKGSVGGGCRGALRENEAADGAVVPFLDSSSLSRFYPLLETAVEFFQKSSFSLCNELSNIKHGVAYLSDSFTKFNQINLEHQGNEVKLIKVKSAFPYFCPSYTYLDIT